ncbi:MAG: hypothetical protein H6720_18910 [Sandaracinus sp.]|nr:hypothetical protein [Sandaracinus sp.]
MARGLVLFASVALVLASATSAHAWTDAHVQTASAAVRLEGDGTLDVELVVRVNVRGGWLESLEIAGLDPNLELTETSPVSVSDEGERLVARASASEDGRVTLTFPRRAGPRRGHHTIRLRYRASLASRFVNEGERARASWTFPGWQSGLDGVEVTLDAPRGARFLGEEDALVTLTRAREEQGERTILRWRRAHLPRTLSWELGFELPRDALMAGLGDATLPTTSDAEPAPAPLRSTAAARRAPLRPRGGPLLVGLVAWLAFALFAREAKRRGAVAKFVVPMPWWLRTSALVAGVVGAHVVDAELERLAALAAVVLSALVRNADVHAARLGSWSRAGADELREARRRVFVARFTGLAWIDATGAAGLATFAALFFAASQLGGLTPSDVLLAAVPAVLVTRHRLPRSHHERLLRLVHLAERLSATDLSGLALQLAVHRDTHGALQDARLRLVTASRAPGLLRLDVIATERSGPTGLAPSFVGLVVTRESTPAERLVSAAFSELAVVRGPAGRLARLVDLPTLVRVARVVDVEAPREKRTSPAPARPRPPREARLHA